MKTAGFTVITSSYLAHAFSARESFLKHNPGSEFYIGVAGKHEDLPAADNKGIYFHTDIKDDRIDTMQQQYSALEMTCALKPFFALFLFESIPGLEHLIYIDADILVYGAFDVNNEASIVLSPHRINTIGFLPEPNPLSDLSLNRFGVFNAGYFEVRNDKEGQRFLTWWKGLMFNMGYTKPDEHLYADQIWLNCVPAFFDRVYINKHPGYNLAYWNLIERKLTDEKGKRCVNGEPLIFFHYSHYRFEDPERMTSFDSPFLSFQHFPELRPLYKEYEESVMQHGYQQYKTITYPFAPVADKKKKGLLGNLFGRK